MYGWTKARTVRLICLFVLAFFWRRYAPLDRIEEPWHWEFVISVAILGVVCGLMFAHLRRGRALITISLLKVGAIHTAINKWYVKKATVCDHESCRTLDSKGWHKNFFVGLLAFLGKNESSVWISSYEAHQDFIEVRFPFGHPSISLVSELSYHDVVQFDFVDKPHKGLPNTLLSAYLVMRT